MKKKMTTEECRIKTFDPEKSRPRKSPDDSAFSETVFIIDEEGLDGLAFFSFEDDKWTFLTDTLVDYYEPGHETKWRWYYPPVKWVDGAVVEEPDYKAMFEEAVELLDQHRFHMSIINVGLLKSAGATLLLERTKTALTRWGKI